MDVPNELLRAARAPLGLMQIEVCKFFEGRCRTIIRIEKNRQVTLDTDLVT
jgi:DNA-binding XRE family transcriptional regulator